jgi:hypothetical protein
MSSESVPLGPETGMGECLSTLRQIADDVAALRSEAVFRSVDRLKQQGQSY